METPPNTDTNNWLVRPCATEGCGVQIRSLPGVTDHPLICRWCHDARAYNTRAIAYRHGTGDSLSKEEFGLDLFESVRVQAALKQAERTADVYYMKGLKRQHRDYLDRIKSLQHELQTILDRNTIDPADLKRLLAIS